MNRFETILVTGGGGYVGSVLVPKLLRAGYRVRVLDLFLFGEHVFGGLADNARLESIRGDLRDRGLLERVLSGCDAVIHLACISNDPSFELDPDLGKSINYDAFRPLVEIARDSGVRRFIYASSSSVYGVKQEENVTEVLALEPLTDYSKYKALCEDVLREYQSPGFTTITLRPATVCGYAPRLRLDLAVNILTNHAVNNGRIRVFGGSQYRPNLHIDDMADLYVKLLELPDDSVAGKVWNVGYENLQIRAIAELVRVAVGPGRVSVVTEPTDDLRSYRVASEKIANDIAFVPRYSVRDAIDDLVAAFGSGKVPDAMTDPRYYNIKTMQQVKLK
ncbi:MAG: NAD-dependent epimerase/dehydratase [Planctomycetaceae bacterium]